ncbi:hypothetical protein A9Q91_03590 [Candidatus Gracilibacteria bacterium 28_42_T64]|nr:hypothetical protein A9Q91_03590 [Candidatus Gracilibacteria bacterium 28_42_T64]
MLKFCKLSLLVVLLGILSGCNLSGTITGLKGDIEISDGNETLTLSSATDFSFSKNYLPGKPYEVSIKSAPENYSCLIENNTGVFPTANVTDVTISCEIIAFHIPMDDPAGDMLYDKKRSIIYATDKKSSKLLFMDAFTGQKINTITFDTLMPESMAISDDGNELYVSLLTQEHNNQWSELQQEGFIAVIDRDTQELIDTLHVDIDPYDIVVNGNGNLIISSGSGQWTKISMYDSEWGGLLSEGFIRQRSRLTVHPFKDTVFAANSDVSPSAFEKFSIIGNDIQSLGKLPYHGTYPINGKVWVTPNGENVIVRGGDMFLSSDMTHVSQLSEVGISDLTFDITNNVMHVGRYDNSINTYNLLDYTLISSIILDDKIQRLFTLNDKIYVISPHQGFSHNVTIIDNPCLTQVGCGAN